MCDSDCCDANCYHVFKYQGHVSGFCDQIEGSPDHKCKCLFDCWVVTILLSIRITIFFTPSLECDYVRMTKNIIQ